MTGNIHHQVIFLAVILALFTGLGMLAYRPKENGKKIKKIDQLVDFLYLR